MPVSSPVAASVLGCDNMLARSVRAVGRICGVYIAVVRTGTE